MKKNRLIALSLLTCTLLAGCDENTFVKNGSDPVGAAKTDGKTYDTVLSLQDLYETLKTSSGASLAVETLINKIAEIEYSEANLGKYSTESTFDVRDYHTAESITDDIEEKFQDVIDGTSYLDDDGVFDAKAYKDYIEDTYDYEISENNGSSKYITDATLLETLKYNYDEYIEEEIRPDLLESYLYLDYLTGSSKYKGQFANQYSIKLEVLKVPHDETVLNGSWNESLIKDVKKVASGEEITAFETDYSFVTFSALGDMIVFESTADTLRYSVYEIEDAIKDAYIPSYYTGSDKTPVEALDYTKDITTINGITASSALITDKSWEITKEEKANADFYNKINDLLIARGLWAIDREVALAKNYDNRTTKYDAMTETEKSEAKSFASTYSSSNAKSIKDGAKEKKLTTEQTEYYTESDYYTKSTYTNVLPTALSDLRGTSAKELVSHLKTFGEATDDDANNFLVTKQDATNPVYLDTDSSNYYLCEVSSYYGFYRYVDILDSSKPSKSISNYQIEAYQNGQFYDWSLNEAGTKFVQNDTATTYAANPEKFADIIELVQISADNILTTAIKKEAIVALFEKYSLEINDQEVYDYCKEQYPDYFDDDDDDDE